MNATTCPQPVVVEHTVETESDRCVNNVTLKLSGYLVCIDKASQKRVKWSGNPANVYTRLHGWICEYLNDCVSFLSLNASTSRTFKGEHMHIEKHPDTETVK